MQISIHFWACRPYMQMKSNYLYALCCYFVVFADMFLHKWRNKIFISIKGVKYRSIAGVMKTIFSEFIINFKKENCWTLKKGFTSIVKRICVLRPKRLQNTAKIVNLKAFESLLRYFDVN